MSLWPCKGQLWPATGQSALRSLCGARCITCIKKHLVEKAGSLAKRGKGAENIEFSLSRMGFRNRCRSRGTATNSALGLPRHWVFEFQCQPRRKLSATLRREKAPKLPTAEGQHWRECSDIQLTRWSPARSVSMHLGCQLCWPMSTLSMLLFGIDRVTWLASPTHSDSDRLYLALRDWRFLLAQACGHSCLEGQ